MRVSDFSFHLPEHLIANFPLKTRSNSRLLCVNGQCGEWQDKQFKQLPELLQKGDLLVFNDTKVIPARLQGKKVTGGKIEVLLERILSEHQLMVQIRASKAPKVGSVLTLGIDKGQGFDVKVITRKGGFYIIERLDDVNQSDIIDQLEQFGHIPLPPYIVREDEEFDKQRYQTVYAKNKGAVAAPTAGLHFDEALLQRLTEQGIEQAYTTLHVGAGTFQPIRVENINEHTMHTEKIVVSAELVSKIIRTKQRGNRVIAVGTTTLRSLESAIKNHQLQPFQGETDIFIYPGYQFHCVDALITNFHLPESTLIMLVSAFGGREQILRAYQHAIEQEYRFYSYGDAMFITPQQPSRGCC